MAAIASVSQWIAEDDLLLKNAIEAGASLEALAKGAVPFSRKFSVRELRDRWHSLLYDSKIAAAASARMIKFEVSASNNNNNSSKFIRNGSLKETAEISVKRKAQSIRKQYYAMRKRICGQPTDLTFFSVQNGDNCIGDRGYQNSDGLSFGNHVLGDSVLNHFEFQGTGIIGSHHSHPHVRRELDATNASGIASNRSQALDSVVDNSPNTVGGEGCDNGLAEEVGSLLVGISVKDEGAHSLEQNTGRGTSVDLGNCSNVDDMGLSHDLQDNNASFQLMGASSPLPGVPLWKTIEDVPVPAMLMNASLGDNNCVGEESHMHEDNVDDNDFDIPESRLDFPAEEELLFMDVDSKGPMDKSCYDSLNSLILNSPNDVPEDVSPAVCEDQTLNSTTCRPPIPDRSCETTVDLPDLINDDQHQICSSDINVPSSMSLQNPSSSKLNEGIMICTLNTEDPEIPCNDDFVSSVPLTSSVTQPSDKQMDNFLPSFVGERNMEPELSLMNKEKRPGHSISTSSMFGPSMLPEASPNHLPVGCGVNSNDAYSSHCRPTHATSNSPIDSVPKENTLHPCNATHVLHADAGSPFKAIPEHEPVPSTSDQEESESDDDIPNYSDIEAMILDMDLCPDELDSCFSRKGLGYLHEDKRTVIRLEQCCGSSKQREIASKGALALFYGHQLRHYIKKTEVILGRATEDFDVDIDLRREGPANKISRRQALIRMEKDGSFLLKNLGKGSIFLNGIEVASGQHLSLTSNSLIEVKDMAFVFEINSKYVRQYLAKAAKRNREKDACFAWPHGGGPE